jgi:hypothetical protein
MSTVRLPVPPALVVTGGVSWAPMREANLVTVFGVGAGVVAGGTETALSPPPQAASMRVTQSSSKEPKKPYLIGIGSFSFSFVLC